MVLLWPFSSSRPCPLLGKTSASPFPHNLQVLPPAWSLRPRILDLLFTGPTPSQVSHLSSNVPPSANFLTPNPDLHPFSGFLRALHGFPSWHLSRSGNTYLTSLLTS